MKKLSIFTLLFFFSFAFAYAQDEVEMNTGSNGPQAGDISGAVLFGRGNFLNAGLDLTGPVGTSGGYWVVPGTAPSNNTVSTNNNSASNIVGIELRYFLTDNIAIKLSGGGIMSHTPARTNVVGLIDPNANNASWIPAYLSTPAEQNMDFNANLGAEYHFSTDNGKLFPYVGVTVPFYYARRSAYDPTIYPLYTDMEGNPTPATDPNDVIVDIGTRHSEMMGFGGQLTAGIDYYLSDGLYIGFETKPASYVYAFNTKFPAPGLESRQADNHSISFFSQDRKSVV